MPFPSKKRIIRSIVIIVVTIVVVECLLYAARDMGHLILGIDVTVEGTIL